MNEPDSIRKFEYRPCRLKTGFSVDFIVGGETLHGLCTDVGDVGIRAEFGSSLAVGASGLLILRHPVGVLKLEARVVYIENGQVGFVFVFQTPSERGMTSEFIASIAYDAAAPRFI
jgi:hypothetical protein